MSLDSDTIAALAARLVDAYRTGTPIAPLRHEHDLSVADGYAIQERVLDRRADDEGPPVGYKLGFTSAAIQSEVGIDEPAVGRLLRATVVGPGPVTVSDLIAPQVEAELGVVLGDDLAGGASPAAVLAAVEAVVPVVEIVDSRIADWDVRAPEAIADNALSRWAVTGERVCDPTDLDLALEGTRVLKNGEQVATGLGADVLDGPVDAVSWLADALAEREAHLAAGDLIITGSTTPLIPIEPGDVIEVQFTTCGSVSIRGV
jgi:2-keto-4-pentenoate hydratase